ncbi:MAG TPA: excinuclease ABC subunit UvrA [Paludibacteraceae bacterium]|nr:excinuclease ABC subunit UvrA [Paludibacteraceae bacterium]HQB69321.1 excinuclease ABC subunit UvrA [Paludibacteraceae bacterium]
MGMSDFIEIKNARVHNLKHVDVKIPRNKLVVVTGLSGSGKSSLAFDALYAEGQRRYVESLSAYVRQFLGRMNKPEVDYIKGIPPAIAIQQKVISNNPRSTVGTSTEIYEYLKLLFARIGRTYSPISGTEVRKDSVSDVVDYMIKLSENTTVYLLANFPISEDRTIIQQLELFQQQGFSRVELQGEYFRIADILAQPSLLKKNDKIHLLIDRVVVKHDKETQNRLADSVQTAFFEGHDTCLVVYQKGDKLIKRQFSHAFEADGMLFNEPSDYMFSFNNPLGACPTCEGYGKIIGIDPNLVIPNQSLSIYEDAVVCWRGEVMSEWKKELIYNADKFGFPIHKPYFELSQEEKDLLWTGNSYFGGLNKFFKFLGSQQYKIQYRVMLARYRGKTTCPECHGTRLRREAQYVKIAGKSITDLVELPIDELLPFFTKLELTKHEQQVAKRLLIEITNRLQFLVDVGLGYLTLNRQSNTLSGGESQRINLATSLGSALVGSLYILDEPSIGLHSRDTERLIRVLRQLQELGNTVVVVEHDNDIIKAADYLIDMGPLAGLLGGEVVWSGVAAQATPEHIEKSFTLKYLLQKEQIELPLSRRKWVNYIEVLGAIANNLKNINVKFPLNVMTVVTGVSGSGKSSLVRDVFYAGLKKQLSGAAVVSPGAFAGLKGSFHLISDVEFVNQSPIGKSSRSNPVTYIKAYDDIRKLFSEQPLAKQMNFTSTYFSFNQDGGRCEVCQGEGTVTIPMQFMADLELECEACHGKRFKSDILEVRYHEKNIFDVLEMTINQAIEFFSEHQGSVEKRIVKRLKPLQDVGIGYVKLGQSSNTLSGGESQRVKLASFLANETLQPMMFIFDEPTTGLHTHDIKTLLKAFDALLAKGHTVVIIEHNLDVIKCADHIIDIGPEGGKGGGQVVCEGTPEVIAACQESYTGHYLKPLLQTLYG